MSSTIRITIGLACLSVTILLCGQLIGLVPSQQVAVMKDRAVLCETIAIHCSTLANQSFAMTMGQSPAKLQGHFVSDLPWSATESDENAKPFPWQQAISKRQPQIGDMLDLQPNGTRPRTLMVNASPIIGDEGDSRGAFVSFDDVTVMEQNRTELTKTLAMLKQSRDATGTAVRTRADHSLPGGNRSHFGARLS